MSREEKVNLLISLIEQMKPEDREETVSFIRSKIKNKGCQEPREGEQL